MKVLNLRHELVSGGFRQSTVDLEFGDGTREPLWFRVPEEVPPPENGNAWLALALPLAAALGEDLRIDLPVDAWLKLNAENLLAVWRHWYPGQVKEIQIHAETLPPGLPKPGVVSSFTAGIDSFLRCSGTPSASTTFMSWVWTCRSGRGKRTPA